MSKESVIWLVKDGNGLLHPFQDNDYELVSKMKVGEETSFTHRRIRTAGLHRKYFALIKLAYENQDHYKDIYVFRKVLEMRAGYYTPIKTERGHDLAIPKSIAYSELDQTGFEALYNSVFSEVEKLLNLVTSEDKESFINELMRFA